MPHLDFPINPTVGQEYPDPPEANTPVYTWDGEKWVAGAIGGGSVRYDSAQTLTQAQKTQARQNIYAAPFDAMAYSGMQINGSVEVNQANVVSIATGGHICDGWTASKTGTTVVNFSPLSAAGYFPGLPNIIYASVTTAQATMQAADLVLIMTTIEGYRASRLGWGVSGGGQPITIGFWTAHSKTGIYTGAVTSLSDRSYTFAYTQNVANVPEYKTVTIPGCPDGAWNITNGVGLRVGFSVAAGSNYKSPANNVWNSSVFWAGPDQINAVDSTANIFRLTGLVVLPGVEAPSAARSPLIMRPYGPELLTCQRYYESGGEEISFIGNITPGNPAWYGHIKFSVTKRAAPSMSYVGWDYYSGGLTTPMPAGQPALHTATAEMATWTGNSMTNCNGMSAGGRWIADARI